MGPASLGRRSLVPVWPAAPADGPDAPLWLGRLFHSFGEWLFLAWVLVTGWQMTADPRATGALLAAWLVARPAMAYLAPALSWLAGRWPAAVVLGGEAVTVAAAAVLVGPRFELLVIAAAAFGALAGLAHPARGAVLARALDASSLAAAGAFDALLARLAFVAAPLLALPLLLIAPPVTAWLAAATLAVALTLAMLGERERQARPLRRSVADETALPQPLSAAGTGGNAFQPLVQPSAATYLIAALAAGALTAALVAILPLLVVEGGGLHPAFTAGALGLVGLGGLALRLPVVRLRQRLPAALVVTVLAGALALCVAAIGLLGSLIAVSALLLVVAGGLGATLDGEQLVGLRRAGDSFAHRRGLLVALAIGQLAGALAVATLGAEPVAIGGPLVIVGIVAAVAVGIALLIDRRALRALRHQVQQFSWNANPPPRPAEPAAPNTRQARLAHWVHRQVETELVDVTLPVSGRHYAIARPSGDGRDGLFEAAKADPERQMPYWAKVWPSGVALADVAVERAAELRDQRVLELGAGLGVTACAVLEEGGRLITADYSLLPLALCRLNGLHNAGRAPGSICFNWRDESQVREVLRRHSPIGLILAADVLYEGRDVVPLVHVIERLLAADGSLWLAEPVRRTAQRFLDTVAAGGWLVDSRRIRADWPDATDGWVNVHVIRRDGEPSEATLGLGAWQL